MGLSVDLISQFAKITNDKSKQPKETVMYGTAVKYGGTTYVKLDGSDMLTPVNTTVDVVGTVNPDGTIQDGERVTVTIRNHVATATGNTSSPAARIDTVKDVETGCVNLINSSIDLVNTKINATNTKVDLHDATIKIVNTDLSIVDGHVTGIRDITVESLKSTVAEVGTLKADYAEIDNLVASKASVEQLEATDAKIENLKTDYAEINNLVAEKADIEDLEATNATIKNLESEYAEVGKLVANKADIALLDAAVGRIDNLESTSVTTTYLTSNYITANEIESIYVTASKLAAEYATIENLEANYADIKLANIDKADVGTLLANIGLISTATIVDGHVTGYLDAVEVNANNITAGTLTVDRLVISGTDKSIVYAINNSGDLVSTSVDTLDGDVITKRTIAADHIIAGAITATEIHSSAITSDKIAANAVTASKISVTSLESIVAKIGSFDINNALYTNGHNAYNSDVQGVYVGSDYISVGKGGKAWLKADGSVSIGSGAITYDAISDKLNIDASSIKMGSETMVTSKDLSTTLKDYATLEVTDEKIATQVKSITTTTDGLAQRVSSAESTISQHTDQIASKVSQTDYDKKVSQLESSITQTAGSITSTVKSSIDALEIGGRNLFENSAALTSDAVYSYFAPEAPPYTITVDTDLTVPSGNCVICSIREITTPLTSGGFYLHGPFGKYIPKMIIGETYTVSVWMKCSRNINYGAISPEFLTNMVRQDSNNISTEWQRFVVTGTYNGNTTTSIAITFYYNSLIQSNDRFYISSPQIEKGNKATDWSPAPEDMATTDDIDAVDTTIDSMKEDIVNSETLIKQLSDSISTLVVDSNGESLMTQTSTGWVFSTTNIQETVNSTSENLDKLTNQVGDVNVAVGALEQAVNDLGNLNNYVKITTYETKPCIELGQTDSVFKLLITNNSIMFKEGTNTPAYINNESLYINKAVIEEELQQGEFVWQARSNGNLGLIWKGATS
jgi:hypothetical protein